VAALSDASAAFAAQLGARLAERAPPARAALSIETDPAGARVRIDGRQLGITPFAGELALGSHTLELELEGHEPWARALHCDGREIRLPVRLKRKLPTLPLASPTTPAPAAIPPAQPGPPGSETPPPSAAPPAAAQPAVAAAPAPLAPVAAAPAAPVGAAPQASLATPIEPQQGLWGLPFTRRQLAYVGLGAGIAGTALGALLMSMDGEPTCDGPIERCPTLYDTGTGGMVIALGSGALLAGAAVLFFNEQQTALSLLPGPGGGLWISGLQRF
jgi:hypothetical protein